MTTVKLLECVLLCLGIDVWSVRDALTHMLVLGVTGSGKSSTTIRNVVIAMLRSGFGALFCTAKPEDAADYLRYCQKAGRKKSVIDWRPGTYRFNPIAWLLASSQNINNVVDLFVDLLDIIRNSGSAPARVGEDFWQNAMRMMLSFTIPVIFAATGTVRIRDVLAFIRSAPDKPGQMEDPEWQEGSAFFDLFRRAAERMGCEAVAGFSDVDAQRAIEYWRSFARLDAKTAGNIRITVETALSRFEHGLLRELFTDDCDIFPELMFSGAVIVMNFPVQTYGEDAAIAQKIFKLITQRACLARNAMGPRLSERPVAIVADECQNFLHRDAEFLAQCRSSRIACLYATQSLPTLYAKIGGDHPHDRAEHFASNFGTIVLHSSGCPVTNDWMVRKIGRTLQARENFSRSEGTGTSYNLTMGESRNSGGSLQSGHSTNTTPTGGETSGRNWGSGSSWGSGDNWGRSRGTSTNHNVSQGITMTMDNTIEAGEFGRSLRTGGPRNRGRVDAYWYQAGRRFAATGENFIRVEARQ